MSSSSVCLAVSGDGGSHWAVGDIDIRGDGGDDSSVPVGRDTCNEGSSEDSEGLHVCWLSSSECDIKKVVCCLKQFIVLQYKDGTSESFNM